MTYYAGNAAQAKEAGALPRDRGTCIWCGKPYPEGWTLLLCPPCEARAQAKAAGAGVAASPQQS